MLDKTALRKEPQRLKEKFAQRGLKPEVVDTLVSLDTEIRHFITEIDRLKSERNAISKEIGIRKRNGEDISEIVAQTGSMGDTIKELEGSLKDTKEQFDSQWFQLPNLVYDNIPQGLSEEDNKIVKVWGEEFRRVGEEAASSKFHWDTVSELDLVDFERSAKVAGSRFWILKNSGARLERALINFMLDQQGSRGYSEIMPPALVNEETLFSVGQLPKFKEDLFHTTSGLYLIPTAEVQLVGMHRDEILDVHELPLNYCAFTPCFRSEAGAAGRDTRGLVRVHQFHKVELVKFCKPEHSYLELENMLSDAESILQQLSIPYRVIELCGGDIGFSAAKTYDIEFWSPSQDRWIEISSCSNCEDFQARRAGIRFKREEGKPTEFVHTLNGSGLAVGRTMVAILENCQNEQGEVEVPEALHPYLKEEDRVLRLD